jgi:hypothetical protein
LKKFTIKKKTKKSNQESGDTKKSKPETRDTKKLKPVATSDRTTKVDHETLTEPNSRQRYCASADEQENVKKLGDENRKLSELVDYERKIVLLNEEMESIL